MWLDCFGEGRPIVVLDAGLGGNSTTWDRLVLEGVDDITRVCVYDRAGLGASDPRPADVTSVTSGSMARELHTLLHRSDVDGPFVLVGHSYGGMIARSFEGLYPEEVAGVVLEDSASEWQLRGRWADWFGTAWGEFAHRIDMRRTVFLLRRAGPVNQPLVVVTAGKFDQEMPKWARKTGRLFQRRLARLSEDSVHVVAERSGHAVHVDQPEIVKAAIRLVVAAVREKSSLGSCVQGFAGIRAACVQSNATASEG